MHYCESGYDFLSRIINLKVAENEWTQRALSIEAIKPTGEQAMLSLF